MRVGLDRSRPAHPRHFAQALHFDRSSGRRHLAKCMISQILLSGSGIGATNVEVDYARAREGRSRRLPVAHGQTSRGFRELTH